MPRKLRYSKNLDTFFVDDLAIKALTIHFHFSKLHSLLVKAVIFFNRIYGHTHYGEHLMHSVCCFGKDLFIYSYKILVKFFEPSENYYR